MDKELLFNLIRGKAPGGYQLDINYSDLRDAINDFGCDHKDLLFYMLWEYGEGYYGISYRGDLDISEDFLKDAIDDFALISLDKDFADKDEKNILARVATYDAKR